MTLKKILVPLDGSTLAETAIPAAMELASGPGAKVVLMRAAEAPWIRGEELVDVQVHVVREAEQYLEDVATRLRKNGSVVETSVWYGSPATSIIEAVKAQGADLIVMTSHGRTGIGRLIMGSVAESVLRGTTTPILLLRAAGASVFPPDGKTKPVQTAAA